MKEYDGHGTTELKTERLTLRRYRPDDAEALYRFQLIWKRLKIEEALLEAGIQEGQTVRILDMVFNYQKSKWADRE